MVVQVGILSATDAVGQRFIQPLNDHPTFELAALTASGESAGRRYDEAAKWRVNTPIPDDVVAMKVGSADPVAVPDDIDFLFSSLPSSAVAEVEPASLEAGYVVSSNSSNDRMAPDVLLTIPEINPGHLGLIKIQYDERGWDSALVENPNCSTITMVPTLTAFNQFDLGRVDVTTLQAISSADYDDVTSMETTDNAIPYIGGEDEKIETEPHKLLGSFDGAGVALRGVEANASRNRIPTLDGHPEDVFADLVDDTSLKNITATIREYPGVDLPSAPEQFIHIFGDEFRPRSRLDRDRGDGMQISVSGVQSTDHGVKYDCLAHSTIRGATGASVLNGELLAQEGWI